jgi:hypothetical protein
MIQEITQRNRDVIRQSLSEIRATNAVITNENVDDALDYFERKNDIALAKEKMKSRYSVGLQTETDENGSRFDTYTRNAAAQVIEDGGVEVITSGIGRKILSPLATMFTARTGYFKFMVGDGDAAEENSDVQAAINYHRMVGGFRTQVSNADYISCAVDSGPMLVSWSGGHLKYQAFSPACIYAKFGTSVTDDGIERGIDYTDIEDAICVVIKLNSGTVDGTIAANQNQYLAIFGRSKEYELGRYVNFTAGSWQDIPPVGAKNAQDWTTDQGEIANPLSLYASYPDVSGGVEYPIIILRGGLSLTASDSPFPISTSLYENCLEIDAAMSRALYCSMLSARGTQAITNAGNMPFPKMLEGTIPLSNGQTIQMLNQPVANATGAMDITIAIARSVAEGFSVPGYQVVADISAIPESGVALAIKNSSLMENRDRRRELNAMQVDRIFEIEKGLFNIYTGMDIAPSDCRQVWNPGRYVMPEAQDAKTTRLAAAGLIDKIQAVMEYYDLATEDDARALIDQMKERETDYPTGSGQTQEQAPAYPAGLAPRRPRTV